MNQTNNKKKMEFPHTLIIILIVIVFTATLAYLVQTGQYDRIEVAGRKVVDPSSYHTVSVNRATPFDTSVAILAGMQAVAGIADMVLIIGGPFTVIEATGATKAALAKVFRVGGRLDAVLPPIATVAFPLLPAFTGSAESMLAFVPPGILFVRTLGSDAMIGLSTTIATGNAGFTSGLFNTMATGVAQTLLGIEPFSGLWYRAIGYRLLLRSVSFQIVWYALKLRKNPARSCRYSVGLAAKEEVAEASEIDSEMTLRQILVLIKLIAGIAFVIYGTLNGWDFGPKSGGVFPIMAVICGLTGSFNDNQICNEFIEGTKKALVGALVVGSAKVISLVMDQACVSDTVVYVFPNLLSGTSKVVGTLLMYIFQIIMNCSIVSDSGQAAVTIPIMELLGDVLGLTPQTVVTAFIFGDGLTNLLLPMSIATMGVVVTAGISYGQYARYIRRTIVINLYLGGVMVAIAAMIGL